MEMMNDLETARSFDLWGGLWLLSMAASRGTVVARPRLPIFLNMYCILVGESGWPRKSTAVKHALRVARRFIDEYDRETILVTDATTPQKLILELVTQSKTFEKATAVIAISELVRFLGRDAASVDMPGLLTDLYDCPEIAESPGTIARGATVIRNAYLTFLSASTPAWLARGVNQEAISGGFTSRILFIVAMEGKNRIPWPKDETKFDTDKLVGWLHRIRRFSNSDCKGIITLESDTLKAFSEWYTTRTLHRDDFRASFESREDEHILRIGALLSLNEKRSSISLTNFCIAQSLVELAKQRATEIFDVGVSYDKTTLGIEAVLSALSTTSRGEGIKQGDLAKQVRHRCNSSDLTAILDVLQHLSAVRKYRAKPAKGGRPYILWIPTEELTFVDGREVLRLLPEFIQR